MLCSACASDWLCVATVWSRRRYHLYGYGGGLLKITVFSTFYMLWKTTRVWTVRYHVRRHRLFFSMITYAAGREYDRSAHALTVPEAADHIVNFTYCQR